ncbi:hypothetical protein SADUNF_Sadunf17G0015900 [Salix dunnii]|uniref:mitogen-activated protein kinase kinase kinase n=1 Tax=Salix dunnii TaxID=1413687 RepID=A0A835J479_9ROSI|nr:hypothetical protein SADUNF_Sadunf17G0015900 [Salix dunnii]
MLYIFLELASHGILEQAYKNCRFKESQVSHYARQIMQGLKYLHSCKVVHGDLKCVHILVTESGRVKLADFGLSKSMEDHSQSLKHGLGRLTFFGVLLNEHRHLCHLENEIAVLNRLDHENIIQCYGTEKDGEMLYIFLELEGDDWMRRSEGSWMRKSGIKKGSKDKMFDYFCRLDTCSDYEEAFAQFVMLAQFVMRLVQTLRSFVEAAAHSAGYCARLTGQVLLLTVNTARTILRMPGRRPIQNEEIAVSSPQASAVFSNPKYRASPALKISRRRRRITDWERGVLIGKGSFASVYRGYSNEDGIFFAAKGVSLTDPEHLPHLENEIAILKLLNHENIIHYYGTHKDGEMLYIFLELASQGTLEQAYKNCRFTESQVSDYTRQILQGLTYLHSCKVVHGDLKCENILVTKSGGVKLADFGLSKSMEDHSYGFPSDICSLGCTVLEMSTRKYPQYNGKKVFSVELAIRSGRGLNVHRNLPRNLRDFINQCLHPDPNQRPTAAKLLAHPFVKESSLHADS